MVMDKVNFYKSTIKPLVDLIISFFCLIGLLPLLLLISFILGIHFKGSPFFLQERVGYKGKVFTLFKFRTFDENGDFESISFFGRFLRQSSMDELPQLFNILKGEMSFVGPRPLYKEYMDHYNSEQRKRHHVRPGLTGLSQVEEGNTNDWVRRLKLDVIYVERQSFRNDLSILFKTLIHVFSKSRIEQSYEEVTRFDDLKKEFDG